MNNLHLLFIAAIITVIVGEIKRLMTKPLPPNAFENQELYMKDLGSGIDMKLILRNADNGKYMYRDKKEAKD